MPCWLCGWWHPAADDCGVICCNPFVPTKLLDFTVPTCSVLLYLLGRPSLLCSCFWALLTLSCSLHHRASLVSRSPAVSVASSSAVLALYYSPHWASLVFHSSAVLVALARHSPSNNGWCFSFSRLPIMRLAQAHPNQGGFQKLMKPCVHELHN